MQTSQSNATGCLSIGPESSLKTGANTHSIYSASMNYLNRKARLLTPRKRMFGISRRSMQACLEGQAAPRGDLASRPHCQKPAPARRDGQLPSMQQRSAVPFTLFLLNGDRPARLCSPQAKAGAAATACSLPSLIMMMLSQPQPWLAAHHRL